MHSSPLSATPSSRRSRAPRTTPTFATRDGSAAADEARQGKMKDARAMQMPDLLPRDGQPRLRDGPGPAAVGRVYHCCRAPQLLAIPLALPLHPPRRLLRAAAHHDRAQAAARLVGLPLPRCTRPTASPCGLLNHLAAPCHVAQRSPAPRRCRAPHLLAALGGGRGAAAVRRRAAERQHLPILLDGAARRERAPTTRQRRRRRRAARPQGARSAVPSAMAVPSSAAVDARDRARAGVNGAGALRRRSTCSAARALPAARAQPGRCARGDHRPAIADDAAHRVRRKRGRGWPGETHAESARRPPSSRSLRRSRPSATSISRHATCTSARWASRRWGRRTTPRRTARTRRRTASRRRSRPSCATRTTTRYALDEYATGTNAVAVISYTGYDMEDAMIVNKASYERGLGHASLHTTTTVDLNDFGARASRSHTSSATRGRGRGRPQAATRRTQRAPARSLGADGSARDRQA